MNRDPENIVVADFREGDSKTFERIFYAYFASICTFADRFLNDREATKECVSDVFVLLWKKHAQFENLLEIKIFLYIHAKELCLIYLKALHDPTILNELKGLDQLDALPLLDEQQYWLVNQATEEELDDFVCKNLMDVEFLRNLNIAIESLPARIKRKLGTKIGKADIKAMAQDMDLSPQELHDLKDKAIDVLRAKFKVKHS